MRSRKACATRRLGDTPMHSFRIANGVLCSQKSSNAVAARPPRWPPTPPVEDAVIPPHPLPVSTSVHACSTHPSVRLLKVLRGRLRDEIKLGPASIKADSTATNAAHAFISNAHRAGEKARNRRLTARTFASEQRGLSQIKVIQHERRHLIGDVYGQHDDQVGQYAQSKPAGCGYRDGHFSV